MFEPHLWIQAVFLLLLASAAGWLVVRSLSTELSRAAALARVLAISLVVLGAGIGAGAWFGSVYPPIFAITAIGVLTFYCMLHHVARSGSDTSIQDRDIRIAITSSITTTYLALVGFGVFVRIPLGEQEAPLAQGLLVSFTSVVGIVIAFYFGTSAYLEGKDAGASAKREKEEERNSPNPPAP